ncbi:MAG: class I SAM-dependent methyltransferase [Proteobacteria bacterium]|nr:class I SAM-dependent methyltransferase [Pseudomonadota bacterium]
MAVNPALEAPENTAERTALWRALHVAADAAPHIIDDAIGLKLLAPEGDWRARPDMDAQGTRIFRASIVARARFIEDLVIEQAARGVEQYVLLGAGLDSFAQRRTEIAARLTVYEVDLPGPQAWKRRRLLEAGYGVPAWLKFVPVNFEMQSWWDRLIESGFDPRKPAVIASTGVSLYLTQAAIADMLRKIATLASGSTFAMTFIMPLEMSDPEERVVFEMAMRGAKASGTPFLSMFTPDQMLTLARDAGLKNARVVSGGDLAARYFAGRSDGLRPGSESLLIVTI